MNETQLDFESFITNRFLEFYNKDKSTNFEICEKKDAVERNISTFDFYCIDKKTNIEMAIEIKRLFSSNKSHLKSIHNWVENQIERPLIGKIKGGYFLMIGGTESPFQVNKKKRKELLDSIKEEIQFLDDPGESYQLKCHEQVSLLRWSESGSSISAWPVDFSNADDEEIVRILDACLKKFKDQENNKMINIFLLVELSSTARRTEIASIIKQLEYGFEPSNFRAEARDFCFINGIYHIGLHRKTVIAQVWPNDKIIETNFFNPQEYMSPKEFQLWTIKYLQ